MFKNRIDAGEKLAEKLEKYKGKKEAIVLGIPRGGVEVASVISKKLQLELDIIVIKKIGAPDNEEFSIGATGIETFYINRDSVNKIGADQEYIDKEIKVKQKEAKERYSFLRGKKSPPSLKNKEVILIDDGIATGDSMMLAIKIVKKESPKKIIVAVPVAAEESLKKLDADEIICAKPSKTLWAIGEYYIDFRPVEDAEVKKILENE